MPYSEVPISTPEDFAESYGITLRMAERANAGTEVKVFACVGPYPVLLIGLAERFGLPRAVDIMKGGMDEAKRLVLERRAVAIGEIGRPHFPVSAEIMEASNDIMRYGMELAKEASCPVVLHTESADPAVMADLAGIEVHDRFAAGLLVAGRDQRIQRERVRFRRRRRLLDQTTHDARLDGVERRQRRVRFLFRRVFHDRRLPRAKPRV